LESRILDFEFVSVFGLRILLVMRYPQLLIVEPEPRLVGWLRDMAKTHQWTLREPRSPEACLRFLRQGETSVLVLKAGADPTKEMRLLERCSVMFPDVPAVVVSDTDSAALDDLAWDLGAHCVFGPAQPREHLPEIVAGLMEAALSRTRVSPAPRPKEAVAAESPPPPPAGES
jgi:hypothetical protein